MYFLCWFCVTTNKANSWCFLLPSKSLRDIQKKSTRCAKDVKKISRRCPRDIQKMSKRHPKDIQKPSKRHPKDGNRSPYKIKLWILVIFRPQRRFSLQNPYVSGITFEGVFEPSVLSLSRAGGFPWFRFCRSSGWPRSQQKWGWVFGFCSPNNFLFKCYVFGFVEAVLVFPINVPTKSEAPTPPGHLFRYYIYIYIQMCIYLYIYIYRYTDIDIDMCMSI